MLPNHEAHSFLSPASLSPEQDPAEQKTLNMGVAMIGSPQYNTVSMSTKHV